MAVFKCKMCGGALEVNNETVATCSYCGTQQTLPRIDDEKKVALFNRANNLRIKCEFDKAAGIYESITAEFPEESEAFWGLVLCKYGIEYVDEGKGTRVPTCHRTVPTSIMEDSDFDMACSNADATAKVVYREEAKAIDGIQKKILEIAAAEEPYDVFICYKETDDVTGARTEDSVIAQDIYTELSKEGYKVFFARVTLRNKAGCDYEPYIYSALSSAKVMLVLGTKFDYFDAVWVKNEWSRYLSMMAEDKSKHLIPCYKGLDAYDIPKEFKNLQALNIGDVTFIKNLFENIGNFVFKATEKEAVLKSNDSQIEPLLKRAFMFLEDGDWNSANEYCEKVLDIDPECAEAYLGKLMVELGINKRESLKNAKNPFDNKNFYQKIIRYGDAELKAELEGYLEYIEDRNEKSRKERERIVKVQAKRRKKIFAITSSVVAIVIVFAILLNTVIIPNGKYNDAIALMEQGKYQEAIVAFEEMNGYKDSISKIEECNIAFLDVQYNEAIALMDAGEYNNAIFMFEALGTYKDSTEKYIECKYVYANALLNEEKYNEAYSIFQELGDYKDSTEKAGDIRLIKSKEQLKNAVVGDYIIFGNYEQDNDTSNGAEEIEWLVLDIQDGKALVVSKYVLDCEPYNKEREEITWETCSLRQWLNNDFLNVAFSTNEKALIPTVMVSADENPDYSTNPSNATQDMVFLLSTTEANMYFSSNSARECQPTVYAETNGVGTVLGVYWWLRSTGDSQNLAPCVVRGKVSSEDGGGFVDYNSYGVRPAMWIEIE